MRWRAERWMKLRHLPAAFRHSPWFVLRHGRSMLAHTFTGTTVKSILGLEDDRAVFERFRAIRRRQREQAAGGLAHHAGSGGWDSAQPRGLGPAAQGPDWDARRA
jgi:hypothetical protein